MVNFLGIKRERPSVESTDFSIDRSFSVHDDAEIEQMYGILRDHDHKSAGTSIEVQCHEDDEHWHTSQYLRIPSIYQFPEMIDFARYITNYSKRFNIPCWLKLKMW